MKVQDPICGTDVRLEDPPIFEDRDGWAYFFCSEACRAAFVSAPERYILGRGPGSPPDQARYLEHGRV